MHVDVGQEWAADAALGRAFFALLAACHAPIPFVVPFFDGYVQPQLDEVQYVAVDNAPRHRLHLLAVGNCIEKLRQVRIDHTCSGFTRVAACTVASPPKSGHLYPLGFSKPVTRTHCQGS